MSYTKEERLATARHVRQREVVLEESSAKVNDAANRILELADQLHLTWDEFERAILVVKKRGRIRYSDL